MEIVIKEYDKNDENELKKLLKSSFEAKNAFALFQTGHLLFRYSAFFQEQLVGVIFGWKNNFHPHCTYFRIISNPLYVTYHVEEKLLDKVTKTSDAPLQTSIWETSVTLKEAYERNGFKAIRRTYMPTLHVSSMGQGIETMCSNKFTLKTVRDILHNEAWLEKLTRLVKTNYEAAHEQNPIADLPLAEWKKLILADDVLLDGSFIYINKHQNNIVAYSLLHESTSSETYELGWCGCSKQRYTSALLSLVKKQIRYVKEKDVKKIVGEFDTTDPYAMEVFKTLPFAPCPTWITYQKK